MGRLHLTDLATYRTTSSAPPALVLGYGNITDPEIPPAVTLLRESLRPRAPRPAAQVRRPPG